VVYDVTLTNKGNVPLTRVTAADDHCQPDSFTDGDANGDHALDPGEVWTYSCSTFVAKTLTSTQTGKASWGGVALQDQDKTTVTLAPTNEDIGVVVLPSPVFLPAGGGAVTYSYSVVDKGNVPLSAVAISDTQCSAVTFVDGDADANQLLDPGETWTSRCGTRLTATTTNTAT